MQLFWVSGAVGQIKTINLTFRTLLLGFFAFTVCLIALGGALQFFGFRMAIEYDPTIARKIGNLHTAVELESLHALYETKLEDVNNQLEINRLKIKDLELLNKKLALMATPAEIKTNKLDSLGMGGQLDVLQSINSKSTLVLFSQTSQNVRLLNKRLEKSIIQINDYLDWLKSKPILVPIHGSFYLASGFGTRTDPFKNDKSGFHAGLDFASEIGTPFFSAAQGRLVEVGWSASYGNQVVIDHGSGYSTRYAHADRLYVKQGDFVQQNALLGAVGSTGRSTGPHLHFEVMKNGQRIDPAGMLLGLKH
jgi:murein DD-endopeptidase MepM/ murein hydrolase activator NlpD